MHIYIREYKEHLKENGKSEGWTYSCEREAKKFLSITNKSVQEITRADVMKYVLMKKEKGVVSTTIKSTLLHLKSFFRWLEETGEILQSPIKDIPLPKIEKRLPVGILTEEEIETLLNIPDLETKQGIKDKAILEVMYSCALRRSETADLELCDLKLRQGLIYVRAGKGDKDRVVPIGKKAVEALEEYLKIRDNATEDKVFLNDKGNKIEHWGIEKTIMRLEKKFHKPLACHMLRRSCATHMIARGAGSFSVSKMLGHESVDTLRHYVNIGLEDLKEAHKRSHPRR